MSVKRLALLAALTPPAVVLGLAACGGPTPPKEPAMPAASAEEPKPMASAEMPPPAPAKTEAPKATASTSGAPAPKPAGTVKMTGKAQDEDIIEMTTASCTTLEEKFHELAMTDQRKQRRIDSISDEAKKAKAEAAAQAEADRVAQPFGSACRENLAGKAAVKATIMCFQAATTVKAFQACQK